MKYEIDPSGRLKLMPEGVDDAQMLDKLYRDLRKTNPEYDPTPMPVYQDKIITGIGLEVTGIRVVNSIEKRIGLGPWGR